MVSRAKAIENSVGIVIDLGTPEKLRADRNFINAEMLFFAIRRWPTG